MTHQDIVSIGVTFILGLLLGIYLYVVGFSPTYRLPEVGTNAQYANFVIVFDAYGECSQSRSCLSVQVRGDGTYRALLSGNTASAKEGTIKRSYYQRIVNGFTAESLLADSAPLPVQECRYGEAATNYRVLVTFDSQNYLLDTCATTIDYGGEVWLVLQELVRDIALEFS